MQGRTGLAGYREFPGGQSRKWAKRVEIFGPFGRETGFMGRFQVISWVYFDRHVNTVSFNFNFHYGWGQILTI